MNLPSIIKSVSKKEWWWLIALTLFLIIITSIPVVWGIINAPSGYKISGLHSLASADTNVYLSYINQVKSGQVLLYNHFTTEPQTIGTLNLAWLEIGLIAKIFNLEAVTAFQVSRVLAIPLLILVSYLFIARIFSSPKKRLITIMLLSLGSGVGAYFNTIAYSVGVNYERALDLWMPEINIFNSLFHVPHFTLATTAILATFLLFLRGIETDKLRFSLGAGLTALLLFNFHPYHLPLIYLAPLAYLLILLLDKKMTWRQALKHYAALILLSLPSIIYHFYTLSDSVIGARATQNITPNSGLFFIIIGLGFFLIGGALGTVRYFKEPATKSPRQLFLIIWVIVSLLVSGLSAWQFGRRSLHGITIPLTILTVEYLAYLGRWLKDSPYFMVMKEPVVIIALALTLLCPTSLFNLVRDIQLYSESHPTFYLSGAQLESFDFLSHLPPGAIITNQLSASFIVGNTNKTVFLGHSHETIDSAYKLGLLKKFFQKTTPPEWRQWLIKEYNLTYLYWSTLDQQVYPDFIPESLGVEKLFQNNEIEIFKFKN